MYTIKWCECQMKSYVHGTETLVILGLLENPPISWKHLTFNIHWNIGLYRPADFYYPPLVWNKNSKSASPHLSMVRNVVQVGSHMWWVEKINSESTNRKTYFWILKMFWGKFVFPPKLICGFHERDSWPKWRTQEFFACIGRTCLLNCCQVGNWT